MVDANLNSLLSLLGLHEDIAGRVDEVNAKLER